MRKAGGLHQLHGRGLRMEPLNGPPHGTHSERCGMDLDSTWLGAQESYVLHRFDPQTPGNACETMEIL